MKKVRIGMTASAPVVQRQASDSQAALFDDDNFVF